MRESYTLPRNSFDSDQTLTLLQAVNNNINDDIGTRIGYRGFQSEQEEESEDISEACWNWDAGILVSPRISPVHRNVCNQGLVTLAGEACFRLAELRCRAIPERNETTLPLLQFRCRLKMWYCKLWLEALPTRHHQLVPWATLNSAGLDVPNSAIGERR
ncbi:hypothetical protein E2P81_ATG05229 [Venturia nashicola]|nr:hypothetical protein E2P81_ATG05229 [Venturia nashicola]